MSDIQISKDATGETMMVGVQGLTDDGIDFVESYPTPALVVDADRIVVSEDNIDSLIASARAEGLDVEES